MALFYPAWPWGFAGGWEDSDPHFTAPRGVVPDEIMDLLNVETWDVSISIDDMRGYGVSRNFDFTASSGARSYSREGFVNTDTGGEIVQLGDPFTTALEMYESRGVSSSPSNETPSAPDATGGVLNADLMGSILVEDETFCGVPLRYIASVQWGRFGGVRTRESPSGEFQWQFVPVVSLSVEETFLSDNCTPIGTAVDSSIGCTFAGETYGSAETGFSCEIEPATYLS